MACSVLSRILQLRISTCIYVVLWIIAIINFFTFFGKFNYKHIPQDEIEKNLYKKAVPNVHKKSKPDCSYKDVLKSNISIQTWEIPQKFDNFLPNGIVDGSFRPEHCNPLFSVAIIVTYRNRQWQLDTFLPYIHNFLRKQDIHYKIYLVEQKDEKPWNKGLLYNIGARHAISENFPCLILHDVDLLPLDGSHLYSCTHHPRHMSASIDKFRYVLPYDELVGGVLAIRSDQYTVINGFSNKFEGWGGEDDDFAARIVDKKLEIIRYPQHMSRYTMIRHKQEKVNNQRLQILAENRNQVGKEGFNTIHYETMSVTQNRLFTLIALRL